MVMAKQFSRISRESKTVKVMISLYCHSRHRNAELCSECARLTNYARERLEKCPFGEGKTTCAKCPEHCYKPSMREKIRVVMRYAGPRMTYRHPVLALLHLIDGKRKEPVNLPHKVK